MSRWIVKLPGISRTKSLRRIGRWAEQMPDPVARLRYLREQTAAMPVISSQPRQILRRKRIVIVAWVVVLAAMLLLWRNL